ncbi:AAA family ATPase [Clostridium sp. BNL1100]|uniref:AAA family ATPase n=1 Tax=Clostridium sp. BNL1100 TaxID=755731 RepID=UPI00024A7E48|nr:AAA family ATPase [Clostridium sp. BNL1100]AEY67125.1 hypothetical protein Clo1100_2974 [Clostridium sp. BNL1100]
MSNIYFFRGKAATGKTTITDALSDKIKVSILRKDNIFDVISYYIDDNSLNNSITYDLLAKMIQTNINNCTDIIVDIGLSNTDSWNLFLSKIDFKNCRVFTFYCDCSDLDVWRNRLKDRFINPSPNQYFKTFEEVLSYYSKCKIELLEDEYYLDSLLNLEIILNIVLDLVLLTKKGGTYENL